MKVLIVGPFPPVINGVTVCNDYLKRKLEEKYIIETINTDSGIISTNQGDSLSFKKVLSFIQVYFSLFKVFKTNVAYFTPGQTFWGLSKYLPFSVLCICLRKKYILHLHGGYTAKAYGSLRGIKKSIFKSIIVNASSVICLSESLAKEMKSKLPQAHVDVVENFFDPALIEDVSLRKDSSHLRIVYLSNLMKEKGILELLEAAIVLNNKEVNFELHIAGKLEQEISTEVYSRIEQLGEKVKFYGNLNLQRKKELLQKTNVFVLPTYYTMEGQPISIIEAYVTSHVVITTDQGGIMDIAGYPSVILVNKKDAVDLSEKLLYVEKNLVELLKKADQTRMDSRIRFDNKKFVKGIESIMLQHK